MELEKEPIINVGILLNSIIEFELKGTFLLNNKIIPKGEYEASILSKQIKTSFAKDHQLILHPNSSNSTFILKNVTIGIGFHWEQNEVQEFEGGLTLQIEDGKIRVINTIPLENYLKSVISSEMSAMNDLNLLKAHAIVSRSWLLAQIQEKSSSNSTTDCHSSIKASAHNDDNTEEIIKWYDHEDHETFDVCADDHCQRYQGVTKIISINASKSIEATRGTVLTFNNEICDARFSKCCGGISEDFDKVWQAIVHPYLTAITDNESNTYQTPANFNEFISSSPNAFCNTSDPEILKQILVDFDRSTTNFFRWEVAYSQDEISQLVKKKSGIDFGQIIDLIPIERGKSGRLIKLKIVGSKKIIIVGKELEIRKWFSESHLFSAAFIVKKRFEKDKNTPAKFILKGAGWGHGVGMCQIGAAVMSKKGYSTEDILQHYFQNSLIQKIY